MDVILLERVEKLGQMGDVVKVKPGYARNYLLPQRKALRATDANREVFEAQRVDLEARNLERRAEAEAVASKLDGKTFILIRQAGDSGQLYGSVSSRDIAETASQDGVQVERSQIVLDRPFKELGLFDQRVRLHPEVSATVTINIARTQEEAERQARGENVLTGEDRDQDEEDAAEVDTTLFESEEAAAAAAETLAEAGGESAEADGEESGEDKA